MLLKTSKNNQPNLFHSPLRDMLDSHDPLIVLADAVNWEEFDKSFAKYYSDEGRPAKPIRMMVGLLLLKQIENLSDENVVLQWKRNPYYQYFCGMSEYQPALPCDPTELVKFRQRIGKKGVEKIFEMSVRMHGKDAEEKQVIVDTTVQEKNVTYPTDGKLAMKMIHHLHKIAKAEGIQLRRTYVKEIKQHRISLRFFRHPKKIKKARAAMKRLETITGILIRDIQRNLSEDKHSHYEETFGVFKKVIGQKQKDKHKIYSLHEPHIYAIAKGKDHKKYEYGVKASIVTTQKSGIIIGVAAHATNEHDSKTLKTALQSANANRTSPVQEAICDRGYRGVKEVEGATVSIPGRPLKRDTKYQRELKRKKFRRRAAIEPLIGHLKADHRLSRNYLKGFVGDEINLLLAATAFNLKKWMNHFFTFIFMLKAAMFAYVLMATPKEERNKFAELYPILFRLC